MCDILNDFRNTYKKFFNISGGNLNFNEIKNFASDEKLIMKYDTFTEQYVDSEFAEDTNEDDNIVKIDASNIFISVFFH